MSRRIQALLAAALLCIAGAADAQTWPVRPVKVIVAAGTGLAMDIAARMMSDTLSRSLGQQMFVENIPGASGIVGAQAASRATPDGYTIFFTVASTMTSNKFFFKTLPYDAERDFVPVSLISDAGPFAVSVNPDLPVKTLPELIALAKKRPGELNITSGNRGSILHFTAEWLRSASGIDATLVHYPGAPQALTDILGGRVHAMVDAASGLAGAISGGSIKALAVASERRLPTHPGLPTVAETLPGFMAMGWFALMAPPKTPEAIAGKASDDLRTILERPELKQRFLDLGTYLRPMSPAELAGFIADQQRIWKPVIAATAARSSK